jgi:ADP-ribose pyrophosphatase YjhB (NUDIX family)
MTKSPIEPGVRAIVFRDDMLLVIKRDKFGKKYLVLPGGGVEEGETPEVAVVREAKEETSIDIEVLRKVFDQKGYREYPKQLVYLCKLKSQNDPRLAEDSIEYQSNQTGNKYEPAFLSLSEIENSGIEFLPHVLFEEIKSATKNGFPKVAKTIG